MALTEQQKADRAARRRMTSALKAEAHAHREEGRRREWRVKGMYLTREEVAAGEPCRGCGLPVIDRLGNWPPLLHLTDEERVEYEAAQLLFKELHPECGSHHWSGSESRTWHCGLCCPPPPIPPDCLEEVRRILMSSTQGEEELDIWETVLTCGHTMQQSVHYTNSRLSFSTERCRECGITRGVVSSVKVIEAADRKNEAERQRGERIARAERELAKAEKAAKAARLKLEKLRAEKSPTPADEL